MAETVNPEELAARQVGQMEAGEQALGVSMDDTTDFGDRAAIEGVAKTIAEVGGPKMTGEQLVQGAGQAAIERDQTMAATEQLANAVDALLVNVAAGNPILTESMKAAGLNPDNPDDIFSAIEAAVKAKK